MFRHQSANIIELIINKGAQIQHAIQVLFAPHLRSHYHQNFPSGLHHKILQLAQASSKL
jgi:hypothetical protein